MSPRHHRPPVAETGLAALLAVLLLSTIGCGKDQQEAEQTASPDATDAAQLSRADTGTSERQPLRAGDLSPQYWTVGPSEVVPERLAVHFGADIAGPGQTSPGDATSYTIEPEVEGTLRFTSRTTLVFEPTDRLDPETTYTLTISKLEVDRPDFADDGDAAASGSNTKVLEPEPPWSHTFETPRFKLVDIAPATRGSTDRKARTELTFSSAVDPDELSGYADWMLDGEPLLDVDYERGNDANTVKVHLSDGRFLEPRTNIDIRLVLNEGLPYNDSIRAPSDERTIGLEQGPRMSIEDVFLKEGSEGFYFHVICDDNASGGRDYYYDSSQRQSYRVSDRCEPDPETAHEAISFSPEVDFRVSPAEAGFRITGDFERRSYSLNLETGLRTVDGGLLYEAHKDVYDVPARSPLVEIPTSGRYITRKTWKNLPVRHRNLDGVDLKVRHVPRQNLIFWMSGDDHEAGERTSNLVHEETIPVEGPPDETTTTWLDVADLVGEPDPGVYEVTVDGSEGSDAARLLVTDINLVVKRAAPPPEGDWSRDVLVWARDMTSNDAMQGVTLEAIRKSGDVMARCKTDQEGGCRLKLPEKRVDPSPPFAIVAKKGEDVTYLKYSELESELTDADTHGEPYTQSTPYRGSMFTERGVYRPGETARIVGVLRTDNHRAPEAGMPVEMKVRDARGRLVRKSVQETNEAGVVTLDQSFADLAETGKWRVDLSVADEQVANHAFNVEEFVPERMDVEATMESTDYGFDEKARVGVEAEYLFGASAEGSRVDMDCQVEPSSFEPEQNAGYEYGPLNLNEDYDPITLTSTEGKIGDGGRTILECPSLIEDASPFPTTGRLTADVDVYESGSGRTTKARATATVHPENYYLGLRSDVSEVEAGENYQIEGIVVDWDGAPVSDVGQVKVDLSVLEGDWTRYRDSDTGRSRYKRHLRPAREATKTVDVADDGSFQVDFTPGSVDDGYLVRVRADNAETELKFGSKRPRYWHRGPRETRDRTPRPMAPDSMHVDVPEPIRVGNSHEVTFKAPYKGTALLTVETDEVETYEWLEVDAGQNSWSFTLEDFHPNAYVGAFLIKDPHLESDEAYMPGRAFGMGQARVKPEDYIEQVEVDVPDEIEPKQTLSVGIDVGESDEPRWATVAAVDRGIHSLTNYETPDPLRDIFARRALGVTTFDTVGWTLSLPPRGQSSRTGGGGPGDKQGRVMPVDPVALWSGLRKIPSSGKTTVEMDIPQYRGALDVMVHAYGPQRIGHATREVKVRDPLPLQATTPRFLTADDEVEIPVFVTNMTGSSREVTVDISASQLGDDTSALDQTPLVAFENETTQTVSVEKDESKTVIFVAKATRLAGAAEFQIRAEAGDVTSETTSTVPFRADGPRERRVQQFDIEEGELDLTSKLSGWKKTSESTSFWLTSIKKGSSFDGAKRLMQYPHGCVEQTTSTTRPLLFISRFIRATNPDAFGESGELEQKVAHGIDRVLSMQTPSGGIGYWPGASEPHPWGTSYATHMLLDAREQGFEVPNDRLEDALDWLESYARKDQSNRSGLYTHLKGNAEAYMHYVLARSDRGNKAKILDLLDEHSGEETGRDYEASYLLQAALYEAGDRRFEEELRNVRFDDSSGGRETGRSFYSDARSRAFILNIFNELFGHDDGGEALASQVADDLQQQSASRYTTQELVWGITGLGKWYANQDSDIGQARLRAGGREVESVPPDQTHGLAWNVARASEYDSVSLNVERSGGSDNPFYLVVSSEGVRENPTVDWGGEGLAIEREYLDREGDSINFRTHSLGDVAYTKITIENTADEDLRNVALVDRIPAGWEVENPRLGGSALPDWVDSNDRWNVDHMNIRDDRATFFGDLEDDQEATVVYATRATLAGEYNIPPVSAEAMYDPSIWARERGRRISIGGPWSELID